MRLPLLCVPLVLSLLLPAARADAADEPDLRAQVVRGIAALTHSDRNWLPVRLVFAYRDINYTALLQVNTKAQNRAAQEMGRFPWSQAGLEKIRHGLDLVADQKDTIAPLAAALRAAAPAKDRETLAAFALAFVQSLPYKRDSETTPFDDAWRAPIQTLVDTQVDCEDSSILYAALLSGLGIEGALVIVPGHMLTAVSGNFKGDSYQDGSRRYFFAETSGLGWQIGTLPPELPREGGISLPIAAAGQDREPVPVHPPGPPKPKPPPATPPAPPQAQDAPAPHRAGSADDSDLMPLLLMLVAGLLGAGLWWLYAEVWADSRTGPTAEDPYASEFDLPPEPMPPSDRGYPKTAHDEIDYDARAKDYDEFDPGPRFH